MKRRTALAASLGGACVVVVLGAAWVHSGRPRPPPPAPETTGFTFCVARVDASTLSPVDEIERSRTLILALVLAVPEQHESGLIQALDEANRRWEARANPFTDDLEDSDPDEPLEAWLRDGPVSASSGTATAAMRRRACATDGFCTIVIAQGRSCPADHVIARGDDLARARFLAWPFGHAVWLRARDAAGAAALARELRARAKGESAIALVLHAGDDDESKRAKPEVRDRLVRHEVLRGSASLREAAERVAEPTRDAGEPGAPPPAAPTSSSTPAIDEETPSFPVELQHEDVLVLPRLTAIRHVGALEREVRQAAPGAEVRAIVRSAR